MIKKLIRLVAGLAVMCGAVVSVQIATSPQAQASCASKGHPQTIVLRAIQAGGGGPIVAREIAAKRTCNGNGAYGGRLVAGAGWTPWLVRKQGNRYFKVRKGNGSVSWKAGTKQSALFLCATRNGTRRAYCGSQGLREGLQGIKGWPQVIAKAKQAWREDAGVRLDYRYWVLDRGF